MVYNEKVWNHFVGIGLYKKKLLKYNLNKNLGLKQNFSWLISKKECSESMIKDDNRVSNKLMYIWQRFTVNIESEGSL